MPGYSATFCLLLMSICSVAQKSSWAPEKSVKKLLPGLRYIPPKTFKSNINTGNDSASSNKTGFISVPAFYICNTEVTNKEYREFVYYVRDSLAHVLLQHFQNDNGKVDWRQSIDWNDNRLDEIMIRPEERKGGINQIDPQKVIYTVDFFKQLQTISIYPDTLVWMRDFSYSYNESLVKKYFAHSFYDNYPVVGVNLKQAMAFCEWKTKQLGGAALIRLPENAEWESAAIGEMDTSVLITTAKRYNCNFGIIRGAGGTITKDFKDDGYYYTAPVKNFPAGDYGLYDMKGNVAEWTATSLDEIRNVEVKSEKQKTLFIMKGGGWNSPPGHLQPGACQYYQADAANSWTGFRYVVIQVK